MSYYLDESKLRAKADQLNERDKQSGLESDWQPVPGMWWYDEITKFTKDGEIKLQPSGIPLKLFVNTTTGEYKSFNIASFE